MNSVMKLGLIGIAVTLIAGSPLLPQEKISTGKKDEKTLHCSVSLKNGSYIRGSLKDFSELRLKTKYGILKIPMKDIRAVRWGIAKKEERDSITTSNGTFRGWLEDFPAVETIEKSIDNLQGP